MINPTILAATWRDGVFIFSGETCRQELSSQYVRALASVGYGSIVAIVDGRSIWRRTPQGDWHTMVTTTFPLLCFVMVGDVIYAGTDDARVLCVSANGEINALGGFEAVQGRDAWYAGSALINGQRVGPPLGVRSITAMKGARGYIARKGFQPSAVFCSSDLPRQ